MKNESIQKKITHALCMIIMLLTGLAGFHCASGGEIVTYDYFITTGGITGDSMLSGDRIQEGRTYQVFFSMDEPERCIKISLETHLISPTIRGDRYKKINSYFIVEKQVDITRFNINRDTVFSEIGRNYDLNWLSSDGFTLCTVADDPIQNLSKGLYRIRFTSFRSEEVKYSISLYSNRKKLIIR
ncbi:MAG TPA: hypothetical protein PKX12_10835 [Spirochaetota bacterium]|nr:hypothetical protein [Spirochaetota bacterium]